MILPPEAGPLLAAFAPLFTQPTFDRFATLTAAAILTPGRHTIQIRPGVPNAKEGGPFFHMTGYEVVR